MVDRDHACEHRAWFQLIKCDDVPGVLGMIRQGADVNVGERDGESALQVAIGHRQVEMVKLLLEHGARMDVVNCIGDTAMTTAVYISRSWGGYYGLNPQPEPRPLRMLLDAGGVLRLREAILLGDVDLARRRLDEGADAGEGAYSYHGPHLKIAAELGYVPIVKLLLDRGADIEATDDLGQRALHTATYNGQIEAVTCLLDRGADIDALDWFAQSALAIAAIGDRHDLIALLMSLGARRGILDSFALGEDTLFRFLLDQRLHDRPDVDDISGDCARLAVLAARRGRVDYLRLLLDRGASHLSEWQDQRSLLAEAAKHGQIEALKLLIDRGADLLAVGEDGLTPLEWAAREGRSEIESLLRAAEEHHEARRSLGGEG